MDDLFKENCDEDDESISNEEKNRPEIKFQYLKKDIPGAKLKNISHAIQKINYLKQLILPENLLSDFAIKLIKKYYLRVMAERPKWYQMQVHMKMRSLYFHANRNEINYL